MWSRCSSSDSSPIKPKLHLSWLFFPSFFFFLPLILSLLFQVRTEDPPTLLKTLSRFCWVSLFCLRSTQVLHDGCRSTFLPDLKKKKKKVSSVSICLLSPLNFNHQRSSMIFFSPLRRFFVVQKAADPVSTGTRLLRSFLQMWSTENYLSSNNLPAPSMHMLTSRASLHQFTGWMRSRDSPCSAAIPPYPASP